MKAFLAVAVLLLAVGFTGCNAQQTAVTAQNTVTAVLNIAQAEEAALPANDAAILTQWVNLGDTLNAQLSTCINAGGSSSSKLATCFSAFASGLLSTQELTQLKILSPSAQGKVQLYATAVVVGINAALVAFKATQVATPTVAATPTTTAELHSFAAAHGLPQEGY